MFLSTSNPNLVSMKTGVIMKLSSKSCLILGLFSSFVIANPPILSMENIEVNETDALTMSIQNLSNNMVSIDLYGEVIDVSPASGVQFECAGYENLEVQIIDNDHDYFEVPCKSRIVFTEDFTNQYQRGE
jgi:hypothetical protein